MRRPRPTLEGLDVATADRFARRRVLAWRHTCRGPGRVSRFSLVHCAAVRTGDHGADNHGADNCGADDHVAGDAAWWEATHGTCPGDQGERIDIALRMLAAQRGAPSVAVWARTGPTERLQSDLGWAAAIRHAAADRGVAAPSLLVVTRWGWLCLPPGTSRSWKRLRTTG